MQHTDGTLTQIPATVIPDHVIHARVPRRVSENN